MKRKLLLKALLTLLFLGQIVNVNAQAEPVFTALNTSTDEVTITNIGDTNVDLASYWVCLGPGTYRQITNASENITITSGSSDLSSGESVSFTYNLINESNGGLGLFSVNTFGSSDPNILLDYLQWGAPNQLRVDQAVAAGRWSSNDDFISCPSPYSTEGSRGGNPTAWGDADAGIIGINVDRTNELNVNGTTRIDGEFAVSICVDGRPDPIAAFHETPITDRSYLYVITDSDEDETILAITGSNEISLDGAGPGTCLIWGWNYSGLGGAEGAFATFGDGPLQALRDADCSDVSEQFITVVREEADGGTVFIDTENTTDAEGTTVITGANTATIITGDGIANPIIVNHENPGAENLSFRYVITDAETGLILNVVNTNIIDLEGVFAGTCEIWGWSYRGVPGNGLDQRGMPLSALDDLDCSDISDNFVTVIRELAEVEALNFAATLTGVQENPAVTTRAYGSAEITLTGNVLEINGSFNALEGDLAIEEALGGGHVHEGLAGINGPISGAQNSSSPNGPILLLDITRDNTNRNGTFTLNQTLTDTQVELLLARSLYINIHSQANLGGELRGQILPTSDVVLGANMSGSNEVPSIVTTAGGNIVFDLLGNTLTVTGSFSGLESDFNVNAAGGAHIHDNVAGRNGPISILLETTIGEDNRSGMYLAENNTFELTDAQVELLINQGNYVNIHSVGNPSGELRGQIVPVTNANFRVQLAGIQEVPVAVNTTANGRLQVGYNSENNQLVVSGSYNGLTDGLNTNARGGVHLHLGVAGTNGDISLLLFPTPDDANSGTFLPGNNTFNLDEFGVVEIISPEEFVSTLFNRGIYTNVHSNAFPTGELRGQVLPLAQSYFATNLDARNEIPLAISEGFGNIQFEVTGNNLIASGSFSNLGSALNVELDGGAHAHLGNAFETGGIEFLLNTTSSDDSLSGVFEAANNVVTLTDAQRNALLSGDLYINVHSLEIASGELRGQILRDDNAFPAASNITDIDAGGNRPSPLTISWNEAIDPNGDLVVYTLQASLDDEFNTLLINEKIDQTSFTPEREQARGLFRTLVREFARSRRGRGRNVLNLNVRVLASDGSVSNIGSLSEQEITPRFLRSLLVIDNEDLEDEMNQAINGPSFSVNVSPNPARNFANIRATSGNISNARVSIYTQTGIRLFEGETNLKGRSYRVNTRSFGPGIYILRIDDLNSNEVFNSQLIIKR